MSLAWLDQVWRDALAPEPMFTVSAWADQHRILPPTSAEPGPWRTSRVPYLREVMDALSTGSPWERVVFQKAAQIGATECGLNWLAYVISHAPGLCLLVQPSLDMARRNTRVRLDPLIESTPALKAKISAPRSRDAYNSAFTKSFPGGQLICTGANSSAALRSTPARYLFLDEIDAYPSDIGGEGDPIALAIARTTTYRGRRKIFITSTPTISGVSRIEAASEEGDQRYYHVPCRHCGDVAAITWARIKWPPEKPAEAYMICEKCGGLHFEYDKAWLLEHGEWVASTQGDGRTCSFHLSALYSPFQTWAEITLEFHASRGDPARLQAWQNLCLGEVYEDLSAQPAELNWLASRVEDWDAAPAGVLVVTAGVDLQDDRTELELVGWGLNDESWSLAYHVIYGDPAGAQLWQELDDLTRQKFRMSRASSSRSKRSRSIRADTTRKRPMHFAATRATAAYGHVRAPPVLACRLGRASRSARVRADPHRFI